MVHQRQHQRQHGQPVAPLQAKNSGVIDGGPVERRDERKGNHAENNTPNARFGAAAQRCGLTRLRQRRGQQSQDRANPQHPAGIHGIHNGFAQGSAQHALHPLRPLRTERAQQQFGRVGQVAADIPGGIGVDGIAVFLNGAN